MHASMAFSAQGDQILFYIATRMTAEFEVMHLQMLHGEECYGISCRQWNKGLEENPRIDQAPFLLTLRIVSLCAIRMIRTLTEKQIRRGVHRSTAELENAIRHFIDHHNQNPKPFVWTKSADQILESVARFCKRTLDSGH